MTQMTITEALAETKTIDKRIAKKRTFVTDYLFRQDALRDPLEKEGGSVAAIEATRQGIGDLEKRLVDIRMAIARANSVERVAINGHDMSIAEWLVWRRELAPGVQSFLGDLRSTLSRVRSEATKKGLSISEPGEAKTASDIIVNINELGLAEEIEALEETLGVLDGQLSLKNATVMVDV